MCYYNSMCSCTFRWLAVLKGGSAASSGKLAANSLANNAAFNSSLPPSDNMINASIDKLNVIDEVPINPQPQPVTQNIIQPKPVEVQPDQRIIRPTYHKLDPPAVNNVFKPKIPQTQQIQMVPVQEVQMVPVQQVQMVPVQQIQTVPVQQVIPPLNEGNLLPQGLGTQVTPTTQVLPTQVLPTIIH